MKIHTAIALKIACTIAAVVVAALVYMSMVSCKVQVTTSDGLPVANARVLSLHSQGLATRGFFLGVTDSNGEVEFSGWVMPHPMNTLGFWVVSPDEMFGGATARQWVRSVSIEIDDELPEVASGKPEHGYSYQTAHYVYSTSKNLISDEDWNLEPGTSKYIPLR